MHVESLALTIILTLNLCFPALVTQAPGEVYAHAVSETSLFVRWGVIFEQAIVAYNVYYSLADAPNDFQVKRSGRKNVVVLGDLKTYTLYVIRVSAVNSVGTEGPKSTAVIARTKEGGKMSIFSSKYCFARPHRRIFRL